MGSQSKVLDTLQGKQQKNLVTKGKKKQRESGGQGDKIKENSSSPKYCKKYVYFDVKTGQKLFEWGGITKPMKCQFSISNEEKKDIEIYDLGVEVKEVYIEADKLFKKTLIFFFAGDFMDREIKAK